MQVRLLSQELKGLRADSAIEVGGHHISLATEQRICVPFEERSIRTFFTPLWDPNGASRQLIVVPAVIEVSLEATTDTQFQVRRACPIWSYRDIAAVKERVHVGAEKNPVPHTVRTAFGDGLDVCSFQHGQGLFTRDRAPPLVRVCDEYPKRTLPKPLPYGDDPTIY